MYFNKGILKSPYCIFIKAAQQLSHQELLPMLGISEFQISTQEIDGEGYADFILDKFTIGIAKDEQWIHVYDTVGFHLWNFHAENDNLLEALGAKYDLFSYSVSDDLSDFDFSYFENGQLRREYSHHEIGYSHDYKVRREGLPLNAELQMNSSDYTRQDPYKVAWTIAESLRIIPCRNLDEVTIYVKEPSNC